MAASDDEAALLEQELAAAEAAEKIMELKMKVQASKDRTARLTIGQTILPPTPTLLPPEPPLILSNLNCGGSKIESATYSEEEHTITLILTGGATETGSVKVVSAKVAKEALVDRDMKGQQVASCVDGGIATVLKQFTQNQVGSLCGLGQKKGARIGEQRKPGKGSTPMTTKVFTLVVSKHLLCAAGVTENGPFYYATGIPLDDLETQGAIIPVDVARGMHSKPRKPQHSVTYCPEWQHALKSTFTAVLESESSGGKMTLTTGLIEDVIDLFWTLLQGNAHRKSASAEIYDKGKQALVASELKSVIENWLGQSRSVAAGIKAADAKKRKAEVLGENTDGATPALPLHV